MFVKHQSRLTTVSGGLLLQFRGNRTQLSEMTRVSTKDVQISV